MARKGTVSAIKSKGHSTPAVSKEERETEAWDTFEMVAKCFQMVHQSSSEVYKRKKELLLLWRRSPAACSSSIAAVTVLTLKQTAQLTTDVLRRHYSFLESVARACLEEHTTKRDADATVLLDGVETDQVAMETIAAVAPFHNAADKAVRLGVVTTVEVLLKALDHTNGTDERQELYQKLSEWLKFRVHDRCPRVREHAVSAVSAFQMGKRECDVTQQLMALLCTDSSADVRRQILHCINPKKEFLEGYFHGMIRSTTDVVARVRSEAWDALGRFPWRYITAYTSAKNVQFALCIYRGLTDTTTSVSIACRSAVTSSWLHRDCKDNCADFLSPIISGYPFEALEPYDTIADTLFKSCKHSHPNTKFTLELEDVHTASLLMWKMECKAASERVEEDPEGESTNVLLPLGTFSHLVEDVIMCYTRPEAPAKVAKFRSTADADNMLRIVLSIFAIYQEDGYLAHADNTTRRDLLHMIGFLLKVVPDDDSSLFVDSCIRTVKSLSARTPEEATATVTSALHSLFRTLKLPQRYALGFEDVEAFGRKSRERQQELIKEKLLLQAGRGSEEAYKDLKAEIEKDEKFLLRIQHIVWSYLSNSEREEDIPTFCTHVIQLGRHCDIEMVQTIATKCLGLQCLIRPETVHTFMPVILSDTSLNPRGSDDSVAVSAIGAVIDLIMEYGFNFFRVSNSQSKLGTEEGGEAAAPNEDTAERRLLHERSLAQEDVHKVGSQHLQHRLLSFLHPSNPVISSVAVMGSCKLLSANRLPKEKVPSVIALLLLHLVQFQTEAMENRRSGYMVSLLEKFFRSYSSSHPRRQSDLLSGGVVAVRLLLLKVAPLAWVSKLLLFLLRTADAFLLASVREIDPNVVQRVKEEEDGMTDKTDTAEDASKRLSNRSSGGLSLRSSAARSSMQSGRLLKELSRHSGHERVAEHLLRIMLMDALSEEALGVCVEVLEKHMYFYSKDPQPYLHYLGTEVLQHVKPKPIKERLQAWLEELNSRFQPVSVISSDSQAMAARCKTQHEEADSILDELEPYGAKEFPFLGSASSTAPPHGATTYRRVKVDAEELVLEHRGKRSREESRLDDDPFGVHNIVGMSSKRKPPRR